MNEGVVWLQTSALSIQPLLILLRAVCGLCGLLITAQALISIQEHSRAGSRAPSANIYWLFAGAFLFSLDGIMKAASISWLGDYYGSSMVDEFKPIANANNFRASMQAMTFYISAVGFVLNVRAIYLFYSGPKYNKEGWFLKFIFLLFLATCCTNFWYVVDTASLTIGGNKVGTEYFKFQ